MVLAKEHADLYAFGEKWLSLGGVALRYAKRDSWGKKNIASLHYLLINPGDFLGCLRWMLNLLCMSLITINFWHLHLTFDTLTPDEDPKYMLCNNFYWG